MRPHLLGDLCRQSRPGVIHRQQDRGDVQPRIEVRPDEVDIAHQLTEPLEGVVLALNRDEHLCPRHQGIDRQQTERRWTVDENVVERSGGVLLALEHRGHGSVET